MNGRLEIGDVVIASDDTRMQCVDGVAAGTGFYRMKILEGPYMGKEIWFEEPLLGEATWYTGAPIHSDGFGFGCDHEEDVGSEEPYCDSPMGGDIVPALMGVGFTIE